MIRNLKGPNKSSERHAGAGPAIPGNAATVSATNPGAIVQAQLDAYNAHDLAAFMAVFADDAQLFEHPAKLIATGLVQIRERYATRFKTPNLHATIAQRMVMGNLVIDHERITHTLPDGPGISEAVLIHEIQAGKIAKAWLLAAPNPRQ